MVLLRCMQVTPEEAALLFQIRATCHADPAALNTVKDCIYPAGQALGGELSPSDVSPETRAWGGSIAGAPLDMADTTQSAAHWQPSPHRIEGLLWAANGEAVAQTVAPRTVPPLPVACPQPGVQWRSAFGLQEDGNPGWAGNDEALAQSVGARRYSPLPVASAQPHSYSQWGAACGPSAPQPGTLLANPGTPGEAYPNQGIPAGLRLDVAAAVAQNLAQANRYRPQPECRQGAPPCRDPRLVPHVSQHSGGGHGLLGRLMDAEPQGNGPSGEAASGALQQMDHIALVNADAGCWGERAQAENFPESLGIQRFEGLPITREVGHSQEGWKITDGNVYLSCERFWSSDEVPDCDCTYDPVICERDDPCGEFVAVTNCSLHCFCRSQVLGVRWQKGGNNCG
jgi:hypothetical protein